MRNAESGHSVAGSIISAQRSTLLEKGERADSGLKATARKKIELKEKESCDTSQNLLSPPSHPLCLPRVPHMPHLPGKIRS